MSYIFVVEDEFDIQELLKNYLEDNRLQQNSTCMIYFSENRKKLEKEATKILSKYKRSNRIIVTRVDSEKFRFTKPEE